MSSPPASPLGTGEGGLAWKLNPAPLEPTDLHFPINLATALRLSDARPLIVAAAQASVWVAEAQLTRAKVLWVPTFMAGADYIRHDGGGPDFNKGVMTASSVNFFYAGPGFFQFVNLADALFEPLAARQVLNSKNWDIQTAKNDALLMTADAYFSVHQYRGMYGGALYCVERGHDLVERIARLSKELVPRVEVDRARNMVADLEQQATAAREQWRVRSADLTQVLRLDPRAVVVPLEHDHLQITLVDPAASLHDLQKVALANRPELASWRAQVEAAAVRLRREKNRPLLPIVMLNGFQSAQMYIQGGVFGLGPNSSLNQFVGRVDVSLQLVWQLEGIGLGNLARIKQQRGEQSQMWIEFYRAQDQVAAEVTEALAHLQSAAARIRQAERALRAGIITFNGHLEGLGQTTRFEDILILVYRPQEAVYSLELLKLAFDEYFTTVAQYNQAQFQLFHALGYPANEIADLRPAGDVLPVSTVRPAYLPPVGTGPPPATR
jgi:outer membrane protein TolC